MKKRIVSLVMSLCMLLCLPVSNGKAARQLNIVTTFGTSETTIYGVPTAFTTRFEEMANLVAEKYELYSSINLNFTKPTYHVLRSSVDECRYSVGKPYNSMCQHVSQNYYCSNNGPFHCNNCDVVKDGIYPFVTQTEQMLQMHITASQLCHQTTTKHSDDIHGLYQSDGFVIVQDRDYIEEPDPTGRKLYNSSYLATVVAHEIGHEFGAVDHYTTSEGSSSCIYGSGMYTDYVRNNLIICSACRVKMLQNSNEYYS